MPGAPGARYLDRRGKAWRPTLRVNALTRDWLPALRVRCGCCGAVLYERLEACFLGPGSQPHIGYEVYADQGPDENATKAVGVTTRLNCPRDCHGPQRRFLVAGRGDCSINTRKGRRFLICELDLRMNWKGELHAPGGAAVESA